MDDVDEIRKAVDGEMQQLQEELDRHGFQVLMSVANMFNTQLGYAKYCVPVPACMMEELGMREA